MDPWAQGGMGGPGGQPPFRDRHLWPSKSSVRGFGYDYDYGYGYVKSVDSMDNVNSVRSAGPIVNSCLLYTSPSPRDRQKSRMPSSA